MKSASLWGVFSLAYVPVGIEQAEARVRGTKKGLSPGRKFLAKVNLQDEHLSLVT
jgi:hypothetical protein